MTMSEFSTASRALFDRFDAELGRERVSLLDTAAPDAHASDIADRAHGANLGFRLETAANDADSFRFNPRHVLGRKSAGGASSDLAEQIRFDNRERLGIFGAI